MSLTPEQLRIRMGGVCGSEIGAVAGLNPYSSPLQVYLTKIGEALPKEETDDMARGRHLEAGIANWWAEETGAQEMREPGTLVSRQNPLIIATPDRAARLQGAPLALEVKAPRRDIGWGDPGTDVIPSYILAQAHWEMKVLDVDRCDVAALLNGELAIYPVRWDANFFGLLLDAAERFWVDHVVARVPPEATAADTDALRQLLPQSNRPRLKLSPDYVDVMTRFREVRKEYKRVEEEYDALQNRIKQVMGEAEGIELPWGSISWKSNKATSKTDWEAVLTEVKATLALQASVHPELRELHEELPTIIQKHTHEKPGNRPFIVRFQEAA